MSRTEFDPEEMGPFLDMALDAESGRLIKAWGVGVAGNDLTYVGVLAQLEAWGVRFETMPPTLNADDLGRIAGLALRDGFDMTFSPLRGDIGRSSPDSPRA